MEKMYSQDQCAYIYAALSAVLKQVDRHDESGQLIRKLRKKFLTKGDQCIKLKPKEKEMLEEALSLVSEALKAQEGKLL